MSISFTSNHPSVTDRLIIGGKDNAFSGNEKGGYGPFPTYSINREEIFAADGTYLNSKYTINISGSATIKPADDSSALVKCKRQSRVYGEKIIKLQFNRNEFPMLGNGTLEINAYDDPSGESTTNQIKFYDARLVSVDIPEDSDEYAGIDYTEYNFTFEAYNLDDNAMPTELVSSVEESWDLSQNEGEFCFQNGDLSQNAYKVFTLTHTLSAVGIRRYTAGSLDSGDGEAWRQAAKWIEKRIEDAPSDAVIESHINNQTIGPQFIPFFMNTSANRDDLKINLADGVKYKVYNHTRNSSVDVSGAGYNLTDTWKVALDGTLATHTLETSIDNPVDSASTTITVSGTVNGLNTELISTNKNNAYKNAETSLSQIWDYTFTEANRVYGEISTSLSRGKTLNNNILKKSVGHNKSTGTITWSVSYSDITILGDKNVISSEDISISYNNEDLTTNVIALIPVVGRPAGPIRQIFRTGKERTISVNLDLVFKKTHRPDRPPTSYANSIISQYRPSNSRINTRTESWNKKTGVYNLSIEWVYR